MQKSNNSATPTLLTEEWLTLDETMQKLGRSRATLERLVLSKALGSRLESRQGRRSERLYSAADVSRLLANASLGAYHGPARNPEPATVKKLTDGGPVTVTSLDTVLTRWVEEQERQRESVPASQKLWLTLSESSAYSGFGERFLLMQIAQQRVRALKGGPNGSWVIARKSLEEFEGR